MHKQAYLILLSYLLSLGLFPDILKHYFGRKVMPTSVADPGVHWGGGGSGPLAIVSEQPPIMQLL